MWTPWTPLSPLSNGGLIRLWTSADLDAARPALGISTEGLFLPRRKAVGSIVVFRWWLGIVLLGTDHLSNRRHGFLPNA